MAADEPRKRRVSLRGRFDGSRDGPCSESNNGWPFHLPLSLSLSLRPCVYGPFQTCGSEPTRGLSIFQTELKLLGSPLRNIDSLTVLPLLLSLSFSSNRRGETKGRGRKFSTLLLYSWEKFIFGIDRSTDRRGTPISSLDERNSYRVVSNRGGISLTRLKRERERGGGETVRLTEGENDKDREGRKVGNRESKVSNSGHVLVARDSFARPTRAKIPPFPAFPSSLLPSSPRFFLSTSSLPSPPLSPSLCIFFFLFLPPSHPRSRADRNKPERRQSSAKLPAGY